ncbi:MAG: carbonic anhydrase [Gammaproteobacteria bacterium]|nr:carbonic anhydrase [Gammaproteobacteria bacterium]
MKDRALVERLIAGNRRWANEIKKGDPEFFERLSGEQKPMCLLIGCSDSRVPVDQVLGLAPGDAFVHRNVGNVVSHADLNCLSVIQFAVGVLRIEDVIICGHFGCGAVAAAIEDQRHGLIDNWLNGIRTVCDRVQEKLKTMANDQERHDYVCEMNVLAQAYNVCRTSTVRDAWDRGQRVSVHGLIYSIRDGLLRDLHLHVSAADQVAEIVERLRD